MSCSLTLQKFLPGGLRTLLGDSRGMILAVKTKNVEAQTAIWIEMARQTAVSLQAPSLQRLGSST